MFESKCSFMLRLRRVTETTFPCQKKQAGYHTGETPCFQPGGRVWMSQNLSLRLFSQNSLGSHRPIVFYLSSYDRMLVQKYIWLLSVLKQK